MTTNDESGTIVHCKPCGIERTVMAWTDRTHAQCPKCGERLERGRLPDTEPPPSGEQSTTP